MQGLDPDSVAQLALYAQVAVAFAGFAGVIGAFSQFRMHAQATAFRVRSMVGMSVGEVLFALLPTMIAEFGVSELTVWRICALCLGAVSVVLLLVLGRQAAQLYRLGRLIRVAAFVLIGVGTATALPLIGSALLFPQAARPFYFLQLFFGMTICAYHFVMLIVAVRLDDSE